MDELFDPKRHLVIEGANNIRDLGGYRTQEGGHTRWRRFLRADTLHRLTTTAQSTLLEYGVGTIIDLRRTTEVEKNVDVFTDSTAVQYHHLNMIGDTDLKTTTLPENTAKAKQIAHSYYSFLDQCHPMINRILTTLAAAENQVVLFHCAAGKDRTGLIAALLLGLAGVPAATIIADYSLSARYLLDHSLTEPDADPAIRTWQDYQREICPPETMQLVLEHLDNTYGGIAEYMQVLGLTLDQITRLRTSLKA